MVKFLHKTSKLKFGGVPIVVLLAFGSALGVWSNVHAQFDDRFTSPLSVYLYKSDNGFPGEQVQHHSTSEDGESITAELGSGYYTLGIAHRGATTEEVRDGSTDTVPPGRPVNAGSGFYRQSLVVDAISLNDVVAPLLLQGRVAPAGPDYYGPFTVNTILDTVKEKISFKLDSGSELLTVRWQVPGILQDDLQENQFSLETRDGANFQLVGDAAYDAIFRSGLTELEFYVETLCEAASVITIPITLLDDPVPSAEILPLADSSFTIGESAHVSATIADAGKNVSSVQAMVESAVGDRTTIGEFSFYGPSSDAEQFEIRVPMVLTPEITEGGASLVLSVEDKEGQAAESSPISINIEQSSLTAYTRLQGPGYRVPVGQSSPVTVMARHLLPIESVVITVGGPGLVDGVTNLTVSGEGELTFDQVFSVVVNADANVGDEILIQVRVYDSAGAFTEVVERVEAGSWGESTFTVSDNAALTEEMRFGNIVVQPTIGAPQDNAPLPADFEINTATIPLNSLRIESGATVSVPSGIGELTIFDTLEVEDGALLQVNTHEPAFGTKAAKLIGHGGDAEGLENTGFFRNRDVRVLAYGSYRTPRFPGGGIGGGGVLHLTSGSLILNGRIEANGGDALFDARSGNITPAGGAIKISTGVIAGEGVVEASGGYVGGFERLSGAGGRIAIYYEDYIVPGEALTDHIQLIADSPNVLTPRYRSGAGTIFLKTPLQEYGELRISSYSYRQGSTTLRSIGSYSIADILPNIGTPNAYDILVPGASWQVPDLQNWELGLQGLYLRLQGGLAGSDLYEIIGNTVDTITVQSLTDLTTLGASELQGIVPLDYLYLGDTVEVITRDTIAASNFRIRRPESIAGVAGFETPVSTTVAVSEVSSALNDGLFYGELSFPSDIVLSQSDLKAVGDVNVDGALRVENQAVDYEFNQSFVGVVTQEPFLFPQVFNVDIDREGRYSLQAEAGSAGLSVLLFRNDAVLDRSDFVYLVTARNNYENPALAHATLSPGSYVVYLLNSNAATIDTVLAGTYQSSSSDTYQASIHYTDAKDSALIARNLSVAGSLTVDSADLSLGVRDNIEIAGGVSLVENDPVGTGAAGRTGLSGSNYSSRMAINAGGLVSVGQDTAIDMSEFGDVYSLYSAECHGGVSNAGRGPQQGCAFGDYRSPSLPANGSPEQIWGSEFPGVQSGGGFISVSAPEIVLQGDLNAIGNGAAGGSIKLIADTLSGAGSISANGIMYGPGGYGKGASGGRVSIIAADDSGYTGSVLASGSYESTDDGRDAEFYGAGTIFKHTAEGPGGLLEINTNGRTNPETGTPVGGVGKHTISDVEQLDSTEWRINIAPQNSQFSGVVPCTNGICQIQYHTFSLSSPAEILLEGGLITPPGSVPSRTTDVLLFRDDGNLDSSDLVQQSYIELFAEGELVDYNYLPSTYQLSLDAGNYILAVGTKFGRYSDRPRNLISSEFSVQEAISGRYYSDEFIAWNYDLTLSSNDWSVYSREGNGDLVGQYVSLDADAPDSPLYKIIKNAATSVVVETTDDLSTVIGNSLIGVHELDRLITSAYSSLSFGNDRLVLNDPANSSIGSGGFAVGGLSQNALDYFLNAGLGSFPFVSNPVTLSELSLSDGDEYYFEQLSVDGNLVLQNGSTVSINSKLSAGGDISLNGEDTRLTVTSLTANNLFIDGSTVIANQINVSGDISIINGGRLVPRGNNLSNFSATPGFRVDDKSYGEMVQAYATPKISAGGQILVDASSDINAIGLGFGVNQPGKGYFGCDAGVEFQISRVCLPRNYLDSTAPGAGFSGHRGGGAILINADTLVLAGLIRANGLSRSSATFGGNIRIIARQLSGAGSIQANAGTSTSANYASGGGLVQLIVEDRSLFTGSIATNPGLNTVSTGIAGGAGIQTYRATVNDAPDLTVSKSPVAGTPAANLSTRVPRVGEFDINDVQYLGENRWKVTREQSQALEFYRYENPTLSTIGVGSLYSFNFVIENSGYVDISVPDPGFRSMIKFYRIEENISYRTISANDETHASPREINGGYYFAVGEYTAVLGEYAFTDADGVSGIHPGSDIAGGSIEITMQKGISPEKIWSARRTYPDGMFNGIHVDLNIDDPDNPLYLIETSFENALVIETTDDLLGYRGETMVGVHILNTLNVSEGVSVDFGEDKIQLLDPVGSTVYYSNVRSGGYVGPGPVEIQQPD